jgi:ADP-heptose:LPS heptosyltransferase
MNFANRISKPPAKPISPYTFYKFNLSTEDFKLVDKIEELRENPPLIVIAKCTKDVSFIQNNFRPQRIVKGSQYVMGITTFQQLQYDMRDVSRYLKPSDIKFSKNYRPYTGQDLNGKTLLVWRSGGIGDLLFIKPNLNYLKEKYPTCKILFACGPQYQPMVETWTDCIDELLTLPFNVKKLLLSDYHALFEGVIERTKEAHELCSYNLFSKWLGLDLPNELLIPKQEPNKEELEDCMKILLDNNIEEKKFVVMQLRASSIIRTPRPAILEKIAKFVIDKGYKVLVTDNPVKAHEVEMFVKKVGSENIINFAKFSQTIGTTIALASLAKMVISPDTSLVHIAESVGTKSFGIYGPFPGKIRLSTYKNSDWIDCERSCGPCFKHGQNLCTNGSNGYPLCFDNIKYDETFEKIERQLA